MDTPEKSQIAPPLSKFEDSPIFNYINSLSPIKPVKSIHVTHTFHSLSFASLPSVFTSPHVSSHKESRFRIRHNNSDPLRSDSSSENGIETTSNEGVVTYASQLFDSSTVLQESFNPGVSIGEASVEPANEEMRFAIELPQTLKNDCGSPDCDRTPTPHCGTQSHCEASEKTLPEGELPLEGMHRTEQKKEAAECDWESLISNAADLLIFNSPTETEAFMGLIQKSLDHGSGSFPSLDEGYKMQTVRSICSAKPLEMEGASAQPGESIDPNPAHCTEFGEKVDNEAQLPFACKVFSNLHRSMRRRCLDFEKVGARKKNLYDGSSFNFSIVRQFEKKNASNAKQLAPIKAGGDSSRHILPGIGLHLNALALSSKESKNMKHETSTTAICLPGSGASFLPPVTDKELGEEFAPKSAETEDSTENAALLALDVPMESSHLANEELNPSSPKKKRRRLEGENEACKRCNCKKSKCLKLYCECFAAGVYCIEPCSCQDCFNKPIHEDTVLATRKQIESRNPLAFAPKVIRSAESVPETGDETNNTPASARHKRGCNCKKSNCTKKYCECYQGGVGCSINCRCEGCKNAFGRKDGSVPMEVEAVAEDETEEHENSGVEEISRETDVQSNEELNPNSTLPITPLQLCRPLVQLPFSSMSKPPRPLLGINLSTGLYSGQKYGRPSILRSQAKFDKPFHVSPDDDMPEILRGNYSPTTGIKSCSPNSKRISPPHGNLGSSSGRRSGRKLILQSIPSFPSLTPPASK